MLAFLEKELLDSALSGHLKGVKNGLNCGANVNARSGSGATPLSLSAGAGHKDVVKILLAAGADINARDNMGVSPLMAAAARDRLDVVEILLAHGADINNVSNTGMTAVVFAASNGCERSLMALLDKKPSLLSQESAKGLPARILYGGKAGVSHASCAILLAAAMGMSAAEFRSMIDPSKSEAAAMAVAQLEASMLPKVEGVREAAYVNV